MKQSVQTSASHLRALLMEEMSLILVLATMYRAIQLSLRNQMERYFNHLPQLQDQ